MPKAKHAISVPTADPRALLNTAIQTKNALDDLLGNKGNLKAAVTWADLIRLNIAAPGDVPQ